MGAGGSAHKAEDAAKEAGAPGDDLESKDVDELTKMAYEKQETGEYREEALPPSLNAMGSDMDAMYSRMEQIMRDARDLEDFTEFLVKQYAEESLQFYLALEDFQKTYPSEPKVIVVGPPGEGSPAPPEAKTPSDESPESAAARLADAQAIFDEFLKPGAERQINVSGKIVRDVKKKLGEGRAEARIFSGAVTSILQQLTRDKLMTFTREQKANKQLWIRTLRSMEKHRKSISAAARRGSSFVGLAAPPAPPPKDPNLREPTDEVVRRLSVDLNKVVGNMVVEERERRASQLELSGSSNIQ